MKYKYEVEDKVKFRGKVWFIADIDDTDEETPYLLEFEGCKISDGVWVSEVEIELI